MKKALISIDYTYDFVADDGKLTAGKSAQAIEEAITHVTKEAYEAHRKAFGAEPGQFFELAYAATQALFGWTPAPPRHLLAPVRIGTLAQSPTPTDLRP